MKLYNIFCYHKEDGLLWFRIFWRYGLIIKNVDKHPLLFSQRNGYWKGLIIGKIAIFKIR